MSDVIYLYIALLEDLTMAIYSSGFTSIMLTKEGAAKANELKANGLEVKVTHLRLYRTPTLVQNLPYAVTGLENRQTLNSWTALPNNDASFELIENFPDPPMRGYLTLIGTLGAEVGTFSYDAVGLFLADDTLYAIGVTTRLLTKRKASAGTMSNIQQFTFNIGHVTVAESAEFSINETVTDYTKIQEVELPHLLPKSFDESNRMFRVTNGKVTTYKNNQGFMTTLASQANMKLMGSSKVAPVWVFEDHTRLFDGIFPTFLLTAQNMVYVDIPLSTSYPIELISKERSYILSLADPDNLVKYPALRLRLYNRSTDATGYHFIFEVLDTTMGLAGNTTLQGILFARGDDGLYQDSILTSLRRMANIQYASGRRFKTDKADNPSTVLKPFIGEDTTWSKFNNRIEVSTSIYDNRLASPSILQPIIQKNGTVKHMRLRASNIWIRRDGSDDLRPELELDRYTATYGTNVKATIIANGYPNGALIAFYVKPPRTDLLLSPTKVYGYATVQNQRATFNINPNWLKARNFDTIIVGLVGYQDQETMFALELLELESFFATDATGTEVITNADEGDTVYFHVRTLRDVKTNATVYTTITGSTINEAADLTAAIPKFFNLVDGKYSLPITIRADKVTETAENLTINVAMDSSLSVMLTSSKLDIADTSKTPIPVYTMYFANDAAGNQKITSVTELGKVVYLIIKATNVPASIWVDVQFSGTFQFTDALPQIGPNLSVLLTNGFASYKINTVAPKVDLPPPPPAGPTERVLTISANVLDGYKLYDKYVEKFGAPTANDAVKLVINSGVYVIGATTVASAIDCSGNWPAGIPITIENNGIISGRGGNGGTFISGSPTQGGTGGGGLYSPSHIPVTVINTGTIAGGGGGSGGGWGAVIMYSQYSLPTGDGVAGHGGRPLGLGGSSGTPPSKHSWLVDDGYNATLEAPGSRGRWSSTGVEMNANSGGNLGQKGSDATGGGLRQAGKGGLEGFAAIGPFTIRNVGSGNVQGPVM